MKTEQISLTLKKAKLSRKSVSVHTDDGEKITGSIEDLNQYTLKMKRVDGVMFVPIRDVVDVTFE